MDHLQSQELQDKFTTIPNFLVLGGVFFSLCILLSIFFFAGMIACSALIGIYFWRQGQTSTEDTLLGGRNLGLYPITASLIGDCVELQIWFLYSFVCSASFLSSLTLLGMPAEVYSQGTQFLGVLFFLPVISYVVGEIYLPIFHRLQLESSYHYLEMRFNKWVSANLSLQHIK